MSLPITNICRVCLMSLTNRKYFNIYVSPGRNQQISSKIMTCAWVQVFDGDGLPNNICNKCYDTLEMAYQFKQLCESSDTQLRQFFGRNLSNKNTSFDLATEQRDVTADLKPINFNMSSDRLELSQCDLSLNALRFLNQDMNFMPNLQLSLPDQPCNTKEEPEYHVAFNSMLSDLRPEQCTAFKTGSCVDGESLLTTFQAKLLEAVSESLNAMPNEINDSRLVAWDLQNKQSLLQIPEKPITEINNSITQKIIEDVAREDSLSFFDDTRSILSPEKSLCSVNDIQNIKSEESLKDSIQSVTVSSKIPSIPETSTEKPTKIAIMDKCNVSKKSSKKSNKRDQCELCGKVFRGSGYLQIHMRTHTDERPHTCSICRQTFSMQHVLASHMRTHSGDKPYICNECGNGFTQSSGLKMHMRLHRGEKPYECEVCNAKFAQRSNLKSHKMIHSGRRDFICKVCNKAFKFHKNLQSHQKTHFDHKEFKCSVCSKTFLRKRYLETHLALHNGVKAYRCDTCGQTFASSCNLNTHTRVHSAIKPYSCHVCKKSFTQSSTLKRHMKQHKLLTTQQQTDAV